MSAMKLWMAGCVVATSVAAWSPDVTACSWYEPTVVTVAPKASPTAFAFDVRGGGGEPVFTVQGPDGVVAGEVGTGDGSLFTLRVFRPAEPMNPGSYTLEWTTDGPEDESDSAPFEVIAEPSLDVEIEVTPRVDRDWTDSVCCSTEADGCFDSCGTCYSCWPAGYVYTRGLDLAVSSETPVIVEATLAPAAAPRMLTAPVIGTASVWLSDGELGAAETCVDLRILDLDMNELSTERRCVEGSEFDESNLEEPDARAEVEACVEPPDDTNDPNWKRYGERSAFGCSTTTANPMLSGLLLFGLVALRRRRRG